MRVKTVVVSIVAVAAIVASYATLRAQAKSVWDGIYNDAQAKRGEPLYQDQCAACHAPTLMGGESAPPLIGESFAADWNGLTVGDLFDRIKISMPQDKPGTLSAQQTADILAFMLAKNQFPVGQAELDRATDVLKQIKYEPKK